MVARHGVLGNGAGEPVASGCGAQCAEGSGRIFLFTFFEKQFLKLTLLHFY
jgi:hypothetical protein